MVQISKNTPKLKKMFKTHRILCYFHIGFQSLAERIWTTWPIWKNQSAFCLKNPKIELRKRRTLRKRSPIERNYTSQRFCRIGISTFQSVGVSFNDPFSLSLSSRLIIEADEWIWRPIWRTRWPTSFGRIAVTPLRKHKYCFIYSRFAGSRFSFAEFGGSVKTWKKFW